MPSAGSAASAELQVPEFMKRVNALAGQLGIDREMLRRAVNVGFSGGEKKRNEILQMALLEPKLCVLDKIDSGLDIDALKVVADGVNRLRGPERGFVVITHYQRLLDYIVPDIVHVLSKGRIVKTGGKELALELETTGYAQYQDEARDVCARSPLFGLSLREFCRCGSRPLPWGERATLAFPRTQMGEGELSSRYPSPNRVCRSVAAASPPRGEGAVTTTLSAERACRERRDSPDQDGGRDRADGELRGGA